VWGDLSGSSLSQYADGTTAGLLTTACYINAGHSPCGTPNGWDSRQAYWAAANACLGISSMSSPPPEGGDDAAARQDDNEKGGSSEGSGWLRRGVVAK
jgi:hypothetical protein